MDLSPVTSGYSGYKRRMAGGASDTKTNVRGAAGCVSAVPLNLIVMPYTAVNRRLRAVNSGCKAKTRARLQAGGPTTHPVGGLERKSFIFKQIRFNGRPSWIGMALPARGLQTSPSACCGLFCRLASLPEPCGCWYVPQPPRTPCAPIIPPVPANPLVNFP
jgi:hypothetical protein